MLWICNPHNPTGQLWSRASLEPLLQRFALVICDEAFLPLVPNGEQQSLIPLVAQHANLVVIRSLTKLYGIAGLRLGYAVAAPDRLRRWAGWRDPWPVNGLALAMGERLLASPRQYRHWCGRVQRWTAREGAWMQRQLAALPGITPMPSAANYLLIQADSSLVPVGKPWSSAIGCSCAIAVPSRGWGRTGCGSVCSHAATTAGSCKAWAGYCGISPWTDGIHG